MSDKKADKFPMYKGKPLVRCGDTIYYGSMKDKYVIKMDIKSKKNVHDVEVAERYLALDIADAWLSRALAEEA